MSLTVNTNVQAMDAQRNLNNTEMALATSMERLSSGLRINSAADDVAGYAIDQQLQGQVNGLSQATQNSADAVSLAQTAQGALNEVEQMLQRTRQLAVEYANGTNSATDKTAIENEVGQLKEEIEKVGETTEFNEIKLLSGAAKEIKFQVGSNEGETLGVKTVNLEKDIEGVEVAKISSIEKAIEKVAASAAEFGSVQDRLQYTQNNLATYTQNLTAAQSTIADVNMAAEMTNYTKEQVLSQAGISVLSQANSLPQAVLKLLEGH
jgi:flagellin